MEVLPDIELWRVYTTIQSAVNMQLCSFAVNMYITQPIAVLTIHVIRRKMWWADNVQWRRPAVLAPSPGLWGQVANLTFAQGMEVYETVSPQLFSRKPSHLFTFFIQPAWKPMQWTKSTDCWTVSLCKPPSSVILLLQFDWVEGSNQVEVNSLFLTIIFSEMQPILSVKGPREEIVLDWESNPTGKKTFVYYKWGNSYECLCTSRHRPGWWISIQ